MAGPAGGPSRRSHTKSRRGCESCKSRHIHCGEQFPQCDNCTTHHKVCSYIKRTSTSGPDLMWTAANRAVVEQWHQTGIFPFAATIDMAGLAFDPAAVSLEEMRLVYHVASIYDKLSVMDAVELVIWAPEIPRILRLSVEHKYVMDALLAFAAMHMAHLTDCALVGLLGMKYSGRALTGLREAIGELTPQNADALVAASLVLSWQSTDLRAWRSLAGGIGSLLNHASSIGIQCSFQPFLDDCGFFATEDGATPFTTPITTGSPSTAVGSPSTPVEHVTNNSNPSISTTTATTTTNNNGNTPAFLDPHVLAVFASAQASVQKLEASLKQRRQPTTLVAELCTFMKAVHKVPGYRSSEERFGRLRELRNWLFWQPVAMIESEGLAVDSLVVLAHYYAAALLVQFMFPEVGAAYYASSSVRAIAKIMHYIEALDGQRGGEFRAQLEQMSCPRNVVYEFKLRSGHADAAVWASPGSVSAHPMFLHQHHHQHQQFHDTDPYQYHNHHPSSASFHFGSPTLSVQPTDFVYGSNQHVYSRSAEDLSTFFPGGALPGTPLSAPSSAIVAGPVSPWLSSGWQHVIDTPAEAAAAAAAAACAGTMSPTNPLLAQMQQLSIPPASSSCYPNSPASWSAFASSPGGTVDADDSWHSPERRHHLSTRSSGDISYVQHGGAESVVDEMDVVEDHRPYEASMYTTFH